MELHSEGVDLAGIHPVGGDFKLPLGELGGRFPALFGAVDRASPIEAQNLVDIPKKKRA